MKLSEVLNWCMLNPGRAIYRERFDYSFKYENGSFWCMNNGGEWIKVPCSEKDEWYFNSVVRNGI